MTLSSQESMHGAYANLRGVRAALWRRYASERKAQTAYALALARELS